MYFFTGVLMLEWAQGPSPDGAEASLGILMKGDCYTDKGPEAH